MKISDLGAIIYFCGLTAVLVLATDTVLSLTKAHPYLMGFIKVGFLATFGECLRYRVGTGYWLPSLVGVRFLIWGGFGVWFACAFPFVDFGVKGITAAGLWPEALAPISKSLWINLLGGYGLTMMLTHRWLDSMVESRKFFFPWEIFGQPGIKRWGKVTTIAIFCFWLLAQTLNFSLPPEWRVIGAAYLAVFLGILLSLAGSFTVRKPATV